MSSDKHQQVQEEINKSQFHDHINKCRCCFTQLNEKKTILTESHQEIFRSVIKVELRMDSNLSAYICEHCNEQLKEFSDVVKQLGRVQKNVNEFIASEENNNSQDRSIEDNENIYESETIPYNVVEQNETQFFDEIKIEEEQIMVQEIIIDTSEAIRDCYVRIERLEQKDLPDECHVDLGGKFDERNADTEITFAGNIKTKSSKLRNLNSNVTEQERRPRLSCYRFYTCDICGKKYHSALKMEGHMKQTHVGPAKCYDRNCLRSFCSWTNAKTHYYKYHNPDRAVCNI